MNFQGYWMPFEAAKAVCKTFCYNFRQALIPLFGPDFPAQCLAPGTELYGRMIIDPRIIRRCTEEAIALRDTQAASPVTSQTASPAAPSTPSSTWSHVVGAKPLAITTSAVVRGLDSGYATDADANTVSSVWTAFTPRSDLTHNMGSAAPVKFVGVDSQVSPKTIPKELQSSNGSLTSYSPVSALVKRGRSPAELPGRRQAVVEGGLTSTQESKAAYMLMQMSMADNSRVNGEERPRKRRASA
jgi:hypothetical protein